MWDFQRELKKKKKEEERRRKKKKKKQERAHLESFRKSMQKQSTKQTTYNRASNAL